MNAAGSRANSPWTVGIARRIITPTCEVELAGLGYYLNRTAERVRDHLTATGLVIGGQNGHGVGILALDLMYMDAAFAQSVRERAAAQTGLRPEAICVNCSHSHNAPTAGYARGVGELNHAYLKFAASQAVEALVQAWRQRQPATLRFGRGEAGGVSFNRTRENGPVDTRLSVLRADTLEGKPLAVALNFHCHLNAHLEVDLRAVSRDWSGEVIDQVEAALPGAMALYLQGTCGDVMVRPEFCATEQRFEVARQVSREALRAWEQSRPAGGNSLAAVTRKVRLPTRRWTREEVLKVREEGLHRLQTDDTRGWLEGFARVIVTYPSRLPLRYGGSVEKAVAAVAKFAADWSEAMLPVLDTRPEVLETEVQAMRLGDAWLIAHGAELFTTLGLEVRRRWPHPDLFMLGYSNSGIGYLPDAHDVERQSYAAAQSPKFTGQFPFTAQSGGAMVEGLLEALQQVDCDRRPPSKP